MAALGILLACLAAIWAVLAIAFHRALISAWREPVLRVPVLILESDDWGFGPLVQAKRLDHIADLLAGFRDAHGRHPVMTLGVILAGPDTERMRADGCERYQRLTLADAPLTPVRDAMLRGVERGVFALQLHGMEHYWPDALIRAAAATPRVREWLTEPGIPSTEALPSSLQSRWVDASSLPSTPLVATAITAAAIEEVETFGCVFGFRPEVAVPPTFVWTEAVESGWARAGIRVVVTPGRRYESRDRDGRLVPGATSYHNGIASLQGLIHVVRNDFFEPGLDHTAAGALDALEKKTRSGRPTLLEIHRINFLGGEYQVKLTCEEVRRLLAAASARFPHLHFMDTMEMARHLRDHTTLVETRVGARVHIVLRRLNEASRLRKLAWATGAILPAWLAYLATSQRN